MVGKAGFLFTRILGVSCNHGSKDMQLFSMFCNNGLRAFTGFSYSTAAEAEKGPYAEHFLVEYLTDSLSFSRDEAISAAAKVSRLKSPTKPALVVDYLKKIGMELSQIKAAVSKFPKLLFMHPDNIIDPKIQYLQKLGLSRSDLVSFITQDHSFLARGLETHLKPALEILIEAVGSNQNALKALKRSGRMLSYGNHKTMKESLTILRNLGYADYKIQQFVMIHPCFLTNNSSWIEKVFRRVEKEFGIPRNTPMFFRGVFVASVLSKSNLDKKRETLRSFGWSNSDISTMVRKQPHSLTISEARLKKVLNFLMKELGYGSEYLAFRPMLIMSSLERRLIPRSKVLKILKENRVKVCSLFTALCYTESRFSAEYLLPYKDTFPDMYQGYVRIMEK